MVAHFGIVIDECHHSFIDFMGLGQSCGFKREEGEIKAQSVCLSSAPA